MKIVDHVSLGEFLIEATDNNELKAHKKAFLFGCKQPDINFLTYLRGSIKHRFLFGHNYENSNKFVTRKLSKLKKKPSWSRRDYINLGKVIHYIADSFTYPHIGSFDGNITEHRKYEENLHKSFKINLTHLNFKSIFSGVDNLSLYLQQKRLSYDHISFQVVSLQDIQQSIEKDCAFIINACYTAFMSLIQEKCPVAAKAY